MRLGLTSSILLVLAAPMGSCQRKPAGEAVSARPGPPRDAAVGRPEKRTEVVRSDRVKIEAFFDIDRVAGGKRFQGSWLILPGGKRVVVSYRPMPRFYRFIEKRVIATGRYFRRPPHVQQIGARHFQLESLELARGEVPYAVPPSRLPAPAVITTSAALERRAKRWVTVRGKLLRLKKEGTYWTRGEVRLSDDTLVASAAYRRWWAPLVGKQVTVLGYLNVSRKPSQPRYLLGQTAICEGRTPRCGVSDWPRRRRRRKK